MDLEKLIEELKALIAKVEGAADGEDTSEDEARMSEIIAEIEQRSADNGAEQRKAAIDAARAAIEAGQARKVNPSPMQGSEPTFDAADYKRAWLKELATRGGVTLTDGNEMTLQERTAYTHTTANTGAVIPKEIADEIISLVEKSAVLYGDIKRYALKHQLEIVRHAAIAAGDAAATAEGAAPANDEQNTFNTITLTGAEIKKTVKMSRKMAVQAMDGFEAFIVQEIADRIAVAANTYIYTQLDGNTAGIAAANKVNAATAGTLVKEDITGAFAKLKTFGNNAPKGAIVYANNATIWNNIATIEDGNDRSYFVDEKTEDAAVEGRIFGKPVKRDDTLVDGIIYIGYPDLIYGNDFDGIDVTAYVATDGTQQHCFDGYLLFDCGLTVPQAFVKLTVGTSA